MRMTKYSHSCVRFEDGDRTMVIDPGVFSEAAVALEGTNAVLITHEHADHLDLPVLLAAAERDPELRVWAPKPVADLLSDLGDRVTVAESGQSFEAAGFRIRTFGGLHALVHPLVAPPVANVCYLVNDAVYHPGDSFTVPTAEVAVLLVPIHAPWSKIAEVIDFTIAIRAARAFQIHDAFLNETGRGMVENFLGRIGASYGTTFAHLAPTDQIEV
jgi:L-ascorbate metabolism protein UlaG (beta-lactamase superfamily)